jgi:hypothetical protein
MGTLNGYCQQTSSSLSPEIDRQEMETLLTFLAADAMRGRATGSPELDQAAQYIHQYFQAQGLQAHFQSFAKIDKNALQAQVLIGDRSLDEERWALLSSFPEMRFQAAEACLTIIDGNLTQAEDTWLTFWRECLAQSQHPEMHVQEITAPQLVVVAPHLADFFHNIIKAEVNAQSLVPSPLTALLVVLATPVEAQELYCQLSQPQGLRLHNVIGRLEGQEPAKGSVIFSAHYDHIGILPPNAAGDSIANGADDDASGVVAVMLLAKHFAQQTPKPIRDLYFVAFTAEEVGGYGSRYFTQTITPELVSAGINIEMIGKVSKFGEKSLFLTGFEKSTLGPLLQKALAGSVYQILPDPYPQLKLFYRSDNATLARAGIPAHTLSSVPLDTDTHYHQVTDEVSTLALDNMHQLITAIAKATHGLVQGLDTPSRISRK